MDVSVRVVGADQALRALRTIEPTVAKQVGREVSDIGRMLVGAARAATPSGPGASNWRQTSGSRGSRGGAGWPGWADLTFTSSRRGMSVFVTGRSSSPAIAAMYETMGRRTSVKTRAGEQLISNMDAKFGPVVQSGKKAGRMRRIAGENYGKAVDMMEKACDRAVEEVNRRMP